MKNYKEKFKSPKAKLLFISIFLVVILGLSAGVYAIYNYIKTNDGEDNKSTTSQTTQQESTASETTTTVDLIADGSTANNIAYASVSDAQKLDLYLPSLGKTSYPVVVYVHGGGFISGDKASSVDISTINQIVAHGYAVASINYRLSSEAKYPAQINDAKAAVRWLRANAVKYRLNADKVASWGGSAGGTLSSLLGTTAGVAALEGSDLGNSSQTSRVVASVDWFGPINFLTMDAQASSQGFTINTDSSSSPESMLMGAAIQTVPGKVATANAMTYATSDDAAFYIQNGTEDKNIPAQQSLDLYNKMLSVKGADNVKHDLIQGAGHGGSLFTQSDNMAKIFTFLDKYLQ